MKKIILMIAASLFTAGLLLAAEQAQPNPFDRYDKEQKKLEEKKAKAKDDKMKKSLDSELKKVQDQREKALKKLTAPFEKERETLNTEIEKAKSKDKNADLSAKQAKLDYQDKMIQYYNDLSAGKIAEMPKDPAKDKTAPATDKPSDKKSGGRGEENNQ